MPTVLAFLGASIIRIAYLDHINWFLHFLNHICQSLSKILMFKPRWPTGSARDRSTPGDQLVFTIKCPSKLPIKCPSNILNVFHNIVSFFWCFFKLLYLLNACILVPFLLLLLLLHAFHFCNYTCPVVVVVVAIVVVAVAAVIVVVVVVIAVVVVFACIPFS